jgi:transcriptional regulator with XRE-family HTH domain
MPRPYLIEAREERDLTQSDLAEYMQTSRSTISAWETGTKIPEPHQRRRLREILHRHVDQYPYLFELDTQPTPRTLRLFMDNLRRQILEAIAKLSGFSLFGDISIAIVTSPNVSPEEYIAQCETNIASCWKLLNVGDYKTVELALNAHMPTLSRFVYTVSPYQGLAANLAVQATIMQIFIAKHKLDFFGCERYCTQLPVFGNLADNLTVLAIAVYWQGQTYSGFYHRQDKAIPILHSALSNAKDNALLTGTIYSMLSRAYSQDHTQDGYEIKARKYSDLAHKTFPSHPESDPFYQQIQMSSSELYQFDGKMYLNLSKSIPNDSYARMAYDTLNQSSEKKAMNPHYACSLLIRKADTASTLGDMTEVVDCLTHGLNIAIDIGLMDNLREIRTVLHQIPEKWQKETTVQSLQKDLDHALIVARR